MRFRPLSGIRAWGAKAAGAAPLPGSDAADGDDLRVGAVAIDEPRADAGDVELRIGGMTCAGCATTIRDGLLQLPGVASAGVSPVTRRAVLRPDGTLAPEDLEMLAEAAIAGLGYHVVAHEDPAA